MFSHLPSCIQYLSSSYANILELLQAYCEVVQKTADSLSMIFATAFVMHRLLIFKQNPKRSTTTTVGLIAAVVAFSALHCKLNNLNLHLATFAGMVLFIAYLTSALTKQIKSPAQRTSAARLARQGGRMIELICPLTNQKLIAKNLSVRGCWICALACRLTRLFRLTTTKKTCWAPSGLLARIPWMVSRCRPGNITYANSRAGGIFSQPSVPICSCSWLFRYSLTLTRQERIHKMKSALRHLKKSTFKKKKKKKRIKAPFLLRRHLPLYFA